MLLSEGGAKESCINFLILFGTLLPHRKRKIKVHDKKHGEALKKMMVAFCQRKRRAEKNEDEVAKQKKTEE